MTGHDRILALRRSGFRTPYIWVSDFSDAMLDGLTVRVHGDMPEMLDLRFLVGVTAIVQGNTPKRVERIAKACQKHAARVIASVHEGRKFTSVSDTEGVMTWQA